MRRFRERTRQHPFNGVLALVVVCVVFFALFGRQAAEKMLFRPPAPTYDRDSGCEWIEGPDGGRINAFWASSAAEAWTVLYFYGSDEDLGMAMPRLASYRLRGFNVACIDYRGYGYSEGSPSEEGFYEDAERAYDWLIETKGIDEARLALHGRSVGASVALELAVRRAPAGLIVESAFRSAFHAVLPLNWVPGDSFENEIKAREATCPALILHGGADAVIAPSHAEALQAAFEDGQATLRIIPEATHRDLAEAGGVAYWGSIESFVKGLK